MKKDAEWEWNENHEKAFVQINKEIKNVVELPHFKQNQEIRTICDARKSGLGAVLQQKQNNNEWRLNCFASLFLTDFETKNSINELELLAIVCAVKNFEIMYMVYSFK